MTRTDLVDLPIDFFLPVRGLPALGFFKGGICCCRRIPYRRAMSRGSTERRTPESAEAKTRYSWRFGGSVSETIPGGGNGGRKREIYFLSSYASRSTVPGAPATTSWSSVHPRCSTSRRGVHRPWERSQEALAPVVGYMWGHTAADSRRRGVRDDCSSRRFPVPGRPGVSERGRVAVMMGLWAPSL